MAAIGKQSPNPAPATNLLDPTAWPHLPSGFFCFRTARRLQTMPGVGPLIALAVEAFAPDMRNGGDRFY